MRGALKSKVAVLAGLLFSVQGQANWIAVELTAGTAIGRVHAIAGNQQVGFFGVPYRASIWHGTTIGSDTLNSGNSLAMAFGTDGTYQVGYKKDFPILEHAALWSGTEASFVDLNPMGAVVSRALAVRDGQQVGFFRDSEFGTPYACMWSGSAGSFVSLNSMGGAQAQSQAVAVEDGVQVGYVVLANSRACYWQGNAASQTLLHPTGFDRSYANAIDGGRVAGSVALGQVGHAVIWNSLNAEDYTDISPVGISCGLNAIEGNRQAGFSQANGKQYAAYWEGTPGSYVNLHSILPPNWISSTATGVHFDGQKVYVVGFGVDGGGLERPVLWTFDTGPQRVVPSSYSLSLGKVTQGNVSSLANSDGDALRICKFVVPNQISPIVSFVVDGTTTNLNPSAISLKVRSKAGHAGVFIQSIEMANFANFAYDLTRSDSIAQTYQDFDSVPIFPAPQYLGNNGLVRCRISVKQPGPAAVSLPCMLFDQINWFVTP